MIREKYISVPDVGHGNPATFWSLSAQIGNVIPVLLKQSGWLAQQAHTIMSTSTKAAINYTKSSEETRVGFAAKVLSRFMFNEFISSVKDPKSIDEIIRTWIVVQEHALLGANVKALQKKNIRNVNLIVPDVFPKESGITAIEKIRKNKRGSSIEAVFTVWNREAYRYLVDLGFNAKLVAPFILDGFSNLETNHASYPQIIVKSGGSGIPEEWVEKLQHSIKKVDLDYKMYLPNGYFDNNLFVRENDKREILQDFYTSLSSDTQIIISPPSEIVQVSADLRSREGSKVILLALPPRGQHELKSLEWAYKAGLCPGVLNIFPGQKSLSGIPLIELSDIARYVSQSNSYVNTNLGKANVSSVF